MGGTMKLSRADYDRLNQSSKVHLANSLSGFKSANLIATTNKSGSANVAIFSSVTHYGSSPPLFGITFRPPTPQHQSYSNIKETGFFTINQVNSSNYEKAHQTSGAYPKEVDEFELCHLEPWKSPTFPCPYVKDSKIKIGLNYAEEHKICNGTILILGSLHEVFVDESVLEESGHIDHGKAQTITVTGLDSYYAANLLQRLGRVR